jgi:hypothetical protein
MKSGLVVTLRVLLLFVVTMGCFMVAGAASSLAGGSGAADPAASADPDGVAASMLSALLLMCGFVSLVVSIIVLRARASGGRLAAALSLGTFGVMTFMYYIEAQAFLRAKMSPESFGVGWLLSDPGATKNAGTRLQQAVVNDCRAAGSPS